MKAQNCHRLSQRPLTGTWFRVLRLKHWRSRLSSIHTTTTPSRYSAATVANPLHRIVYLGGTLPVALHEARALVGTPPGVVVSNPHGSWAILALQVQLNRIVDLSLTTEQRKIGTNYAELTGNWINSPGVAPTQTLGQSLFQLPGLEGFVYPSSLVNEVCLGIFPDKLGPNSAITFHNELSGRRERLI